MNTKAYKTELGDSLYFGPWGECNPEKAMTLIRMAELELSDPEMAELYCYYVYTCFDNSIKYGEESRSYYEKAVSVFDKLITLLDRQNSNVVFQDVAETVENIIELASQASGWASGYDWYLSEKWWSCKWNDEDD